MDAILKAKIRELNQLGINDRQISIMLGVSHSGVNKYRNEMGLECKRPKSRITYELAGQLRTRHMLGEKLADLASEIGVHYMGILKKWKQYGMESRKRKETLYYTYRKNCFDKIDNESAYWIGFLIADGCNLGTKITTTLAIKDKWHLEKLKSWMDYAGPVRCSITSSGYEISSLSFGDKGTIKKLSEWGVTERKSKTAKAHSQLVCNRHFWRGVVDGDGWLLTVDKKYNYPHLGVCGSMPLMNQFADYAKAMTGERPTVLPHKGIFRVRFSGTKATPIINYLYSETQIGFRLDRKYESAKQYLYGTD